MKDNLPKMTKITQACFHLSELAGNKIFPGLDANKSALFQELRMLKQNMVKQASTKVEESNRDHLNKSENSNSCGFLDDICDVIIHDTDTNEACDMLLHDMDEK